MLPKMRCDGVDPQTGKGTGTGSKKAVIQGDLSIKANTKDYQLLANQKKSKAWPLNSMVYSRAIGHRLQTSQC